jgi:imidazolonepropionase-like amidohydrolase
MKTILKALIILCFLFSWATAQIAVVGKTVYTMAGTPITDGVVLIKNGKIDKVGPKAKIEIPKDYTIVTGQIVTPGLIDAHSVVGLAGIYNQREDQDQLDKTNAIQPELRALDAYNAREELIGWLRSYGITTVHTGHAPGALISGQSIIVKTAGETVEEALIDSSAMLTMTLGATVGRNFKSPGTRAKGMALLRNEFLKAQAYQRKMQNKDKSKRPSRDLKMEVLSETLSGKLPVLITAHRAPEIMSALRLAREFGLKLVLDGAAESYLLIDEIKAAKIPVIIHPTMVRNYGDTENAAFTTAGILSFNDIPIAFQSGYESYVPKTRVALFEAAVAVGHGMPFTDALESLTIGAAKILGIADRVGSLEKGKDADVVVFDGDPFEYLSHVCTVIINGKIVHQECK